ncbi:MAG: hypothetical protein JW726_02990 [Anaerolineales bacterium]|nr:hypothetical protein [Anaerolineales bacterium]
MKYGYFDDQQREYVITNPRTPVKWINYIGTLAFGGFVDQTGGALLCKQDPTYNRITKYITQLPAADLKGTGIYLRVRQGDGYRVFSPFFVPTLNAYDRYECHVGLGYMRIVSEFYGVRSDVFIFVPPGAECEIRDICITNLSQAPLEIDAIPVVEYTHPDALKQLTNADWVPQTMQSKAVVEADQCTVLVQYPFMNRELQVNYFTSNLPVSSFETDRRKFLGENEYRGWASPGTLLQPELNNSQALRGDNIAALMHHLGTLRPGEESRLITQLGQAPSLDAAYPSIRHYRQPAAVDEARQQMASFWEQYLSHITVNTPDVEMNRLLNLYNPRQCYITRNWSRYLSYYQLGYGSRGIGFRDSSQDVMGTIAHAPQESLALIRQLLSVQKRNGSAMHQFNPLTMMGETGDSADELGKPRYYSDDHLWIVLAVCAFLKETGNLAFLEEVIPFYEKNPQGKALETGTVLNHLRRAIAFTWGDVGAHGLPLLGFADWNDTVNLREGAESFFTAALFGRALVEMTELENQLGNNREARLFQEYYNTMRQRVNEYGWDGSWYLRYFDYNGTPLGSHQNEYGQIYVNGQSWPVIAGFAPIERAREALDSVSKRLNTSNGIKLSTPGFNGFDPKRGGITTYPPGAKENSGIFLHANPWVILAETMLGNGDGAYQYYHQINPIAKNDCIDEYECEPYVYPQNILGDEHPLFGLARNSWLSGTASWAYQVATQYILGVRPSYQGLVVDPCIPSAWDSFEVDRAFRGSFYHIQVHNPQHVCKGVHRLLLDGQRIEGNVIPIGVPGSEHNVSITLGEDHD